MGAGSWLKKRIFILVLGILLLSFQGLWAAVPGLINYQGKLLEGGQPVTTDVQSPLAITFRFYDASASGSLLFEEEQDVAVVEGVYSVQLGQSTTGSGSYGTLIEAVASEANVWLEVEINGETLLPRQKFTSTPYAISAGVAAVAVTVMDSAINSAAITNNSVTAEKLADGSVTLAKLSADTCAEGQIMVKTASGWACGTPAVPICQPGDFISCYSGAPGTMGVAACTAGVRYCNESGTGYGQCVGEVIPQAETCDDIDNDCSGLVDDNVPGTPLWYLDADGDGYGDPAVTANFCPGHELSGYVQNSDDCNDASYAVNPSFGERCDGTDSNCDGEIDNGCVTTACTEAEISQVLQGNMNISSACRTAGAALVSCMQNHSCGSLSAPDFDCVRTSCASEWESAIGSVPPECQAGETRVCGTNEGACQTGIETCTAGNTWSGDCVGEIAPVAEVCDGIDNNCDGIIDQMADLQWCHDEDGDRYASGCIEECDQPGQEWVPYSEILGEGDCDDSNAGIYPGVPEICDGLDNNCDGEIDEGNPGGGGSCITGQVGVCSEGTEVCSEGAISCVPVVDAQPEICDGLDNDCDGEVDESLFSPVWNDNQAGVCHGSRKICDGVNGWVESDYATIPGYEQVETSCDTLDNDCDGSVDEDLEGPLTANQTGVCAGRHMICFAGGWRDPPVYSECTDNGNCNDGLDNDCDGLTDSADSDCH
jgi:hypothetical protein